MNAGDLEATVTKLREAVVGDPSNTDLRIELIRELAAAGHTAEAIQALADSGATLEARGDVESAIEVYRQATDLPNANGEVLMQLGSLLLRTGKPDQARVEFERALERGADGPVRSGLAEAYLALGETSLRSGQYGEALRFLDLAIEHDLADARVLSARGRALAGTQDRGAALRAFDEAVQLDPTSTDAHFQRALLLFDEEEVAAALEDLKRTIELDQSTAVLTDRSLSARILVANVYASLDNPEGALAMCEEIRRLALASPRDGVWTGHEAVVALVEGWAKHLLNETDEAVDALAPARDHPAFSIRARWLQTALLWSQGRYRRAWTNIADIEKVWELRTSPGGQPVDTEERRAYGGALQALGEFDAAQEVFERGTRDFERHTGFWVDLGSLLLERSECESPGTDWYVRSRRAFARAATLLRHDLSRRVGASAEALALAHLRLGHANIALEDYQAARDHLFSARNLTTLASVKALAESNLGMVFAREGEFGRADKYFAAALRERPYDPGLRLRVADASLRLGESAKAEDQFRAILRSAPENVDARIGLGQALAELAEKDEPDLYQAAISEFSQALRLAATMRGDIRRRCASISLTPRRAAAVYYARGHARVQLYESRGSGPLSRRSEGRLLKLAERDFRRALNEDSAHSRARRAADKVRAARRQAVPRQFLEQVAPIVVALVSLVLLVLVQLNYFAGFPGDELSGTSWQVATLGLLAFMVAGFSLPHLLKLKVAGIELQRAQVEQTAPAPPLSIARDVIVGSVLPDFSPTYIEVADGSASRHADEGIRRGAGPRDEAVVAAGEGAKADFE